MKRTSRTHNRSPLGRHTICALTVAASAVLLSGCGVLGSFLSPNGSLEYQREQLKRFDPYPDQDIAPPMVGVRPPDFVAPPEGERAFWGTKRRSPW